MLLLFALSACDEVGDYEDDPRSIQVVIDEEPEGEDGTDPERDDSGIDECVCECPLPETEAEPTEEPGSDHPGKGKKPEKDKPDNGKGGGKPE